LILFAYSLISLLSSASNKTGSAFAPVKQASDIQQVSPQTNTQKIVVDVEGGAVVKPGIYSLDLDLRVQDALVLWTIPVLMILGKVDAIFVYLCLRFFFIFKN
jgi:hypothetical protein